MLTSEQAEVVDEAMTTAGHIIQTAYKNGADIVHVSVEPDSLTLLITPSTKFNLESLQAAHSAYAFLRGSDEKASQNGMAGLVFVNIDYASGESEPTISVPGPTGN